MSAASNSKPFVCWPVSLQMPGRPITYDRSRTALAAAGYIRRDRFVRGEPELVDFTKRGGDLVARIPIIGRDAPKWARSPFRRWALADEASDRTGNPEDIRAWHVVADLPPSATAGQWVDGVTELVSLALPHTAIADIAIHKPDDGIPAHAHLLVASRIAGEWAYDAVDYEMHFALNTALRLVWQEWAVEREGKAVCHDN